MTRPKDEMGSQIVSSESDISHPILVYLRVSRNNNSPQAQARRFPGLWQRRAFGACHFSSHFRIQVRSADECVAPGRRQPRETRWTSDGRLSSPETNLKVGLLPLFFMHATSSFTLCFCHLWCELPQQTNNKQIQVTWSNPELFNKKTSTVHIALSRLDASQRLFQGKEDERKCPGEWRHSSAFSKRDRFGMASGKRGTLLKSKLASPRVSEVNVHTVRDRWRWRVSKLSGFGRLIGTGGWLLHCSPTLRGQRLWGSLEVSEWEAFYQNQWRCGCHVGLSRTWLQLATALSITWHTMLCCLSLSLDQTHHGTPGEEPQWLQVNMMATTPDIIIVCLWSFCKIRSRRTLCRRTLRLEPPPPKKKKKLRTCQAGIFRFRTIFIWCMYTLQDQFTDLLLRQRSSHVHRVTFSASAHLWISCISLATFLQKCALIVRPAGWIRFRTKWLEF